MKSGVLILAVLLAGSPAVAQNPARYRVIDVGTLGGATSTANASTSGGLVVGAAAVPAGDLHAYQFDISTGVRIDLGTLGGAASVANSVAINGDVVGRSLNAAGALHAFYWTKSDRRMRDLGTLGGAASSAVGVNNLGAAVGWCELPSGDTHACLFDGAASAPRDLGTLGGFSSTAYSITDNRLVVGSADTQSGTTHAVTWDCAQAGCPIWDLGTVDANNAYGVGVTAGGVVYGASETPWEHLNGAYSPPGYSLFWFGAAADNGSDTAFNGGTDAGFVGYGRYSNDETYAAYFAYDGNRTDLNMAIPRGSGWALSTATSIQENGLITGVGTVGGVEHGFVLVQNQGDCAAAPFSASCLAGTWTASTINGKPVPAFVNSANHEQWLSHVVTFDANGSFTSVLTWKEFENGTLVDSGTEHQQGKVVSDGITATLSNADGFMARGMVDSDGLLKLVMDGGVVGMYRRRSPAAATMTIDRTSASFAAVGTSAGFTAQTSSQTVRLLQSGSGAVTWTASTSAPWLTVTPSSGTGAATLSVGVAFVPGLTAQQSGTVTLTFDGAEPASAIVSVTLNVTAAGAAPFGSFDTPVDGSTGLTGSIAITGWTLDDIGIARIRIMRNPMAGEGTLPVFIGDAVRVDGARPDLQAAYGTMPESGRGGWGYLALTNFFPNGGNGTFTLYAFADDVEGHSTLLGTKTITLANASATTPFGAIDTPGQGETVSGVVNNFGWVLSPGQRRADPIGGGTVNVVVDGAVVGSPGGWSARSDISGFFPQAQYGGVDHAVGVFPLDTTTLSNGVHTIAWGVSDSAGGAAGVGSRYFTVANGASAAQTLAPSSSALLAASASDEAAGVDAGTTPDGIRGRRGFDLAAPLRTYHRDDGGVIVMQAEELDRIELRVRATAGQLVTANGFQPLPSGSRLDARGTFTWSPGVGFIGAYDFRFTTAAGDVPVRIVINPKGSRRVGPQVVIDGPSDGQDLTPRFTIGGWAADLDATDGTGITAIHVWAYPADGSRPLFLGAAAMNGAREDVGAAYGEQFTASGYNLTVADLPRGTYDLAVFALSGDRGDWLPAKTVRVTIR